MSIIKRFLSMTSRRIDLLGLIVYVTLLVPIILFFKVGFSVATILFFLVPTVYLSFRGGLPWKRIVFASLLFGFLLAQMDFLAEFNRAWVVPKLFFETRIFGIIGIDVIAWGFLWAFFILIFYERFSEHDRSSKISKHFNILTLVSIISCIVILVKFYFSSSRIQMPYAYLFLGLVGVLVFFLVILRIKKPYFILRKFWLTVVFLFLYI